MEKAGRIWYTGPYSRQTKGEETVKIRDILAEGRPTLSFEVFPPKTEDRFEAVEGAALAIAELKPSFMSVTYGACLFLAVIKLHRGSGRPDGR